MIDKTDYLPISPVCAYCRRLISTSERTCEAYSEIPAAIWNGMDVHRDHYPGDGGLMFEPIGQKHMPGYHDQGSHGNRYGADGAQTQVGRSLDPNQVIRPPRTDIVDVIQDQNRGFTRAETLDKITPTTLVDTETLYRPPPKNTAEVADRVKAPKFTTAEQAHSYIEAKYAKAVWSVRNIRPEAANIAVATLADVFENVPGFKKLDKFVAMPGVFDARAALADGPQYMSVGTEFDRSMESMLDALVRNGFEGSEEFAKPTLEALERGEEYVESDGVKYHSLYAFAGNTFEGAIRHEMGHLVHNHLRAEACKFFGIKNPSDFGGDDYEMMLATKYSPTGRGKDNFNECMAENFALYSIGKVKYLHPDVIKFFESNTKYKWVSEKLYRAFARLFEPHGQKHLPGYHDQGSHGNRYGPSGDQTQVGRSRDPDQVIRHPARLDWARRLGVPPRDTTIGPPGVREETMMQLEEPVISEYRTGPDKDWLLAPTFTSQAEAIKWAAAKKYVIYKCDFDQFGMATVQAVCDTLEDAYGHTNVRPLNTLTAMGGTNAAAPGHPGASFIQLGTGVLPMDVLLQRHVLRDGAEVARVQALFAKGEKYADNKFIKEHSKYYFASSIEACTRHELGHNWYNANHTEVAKLFGVSIDECSGANTARAMEAARKYSPTTRGAEDFHECMAENFTLYSVGRTDLMHPDMVKFFETNTKWKWPAAKLYGALRRKYMRLFDPYHPIGGL